MDDNLEINGNDFVYYIKTYHTYQGDYEIKDGQIRVRIWNNYKGRTVKEKTYTSKVLGWMADDQIREYILDCLCGFDTRIDEHNLGIKKL